MAAPEDVLLPAPHETGGVADDRRDRPDVPVLSLLAYGVNLRSRAGASARELESAVTAAFASMSADHADHEENT